MIFLKNNIYWMDFSACKNCSAGVTDDCFAENCITADGVERGVLSINRQIPGPAVQVSASFGIGFE